MDYRATLTLDYTDSTNTNARYLMFSAMQKGGWKYAETSAMYIECTDLHPVLLGLEILAKSLRDPGTLSACTITIQLVKPNGTVPGNQNPENAYLKIIEKPLPSEE